MHQRPGVEFAGPLVHPPPRRSMIPSQAFSATLPRSIRSKGMDKPRQRQGSFRYSYLLGVGTQHRDPHPCLHQHFPTIPPSFGFSGFSSCTVLFEGPLHHPPHSLVYKLAHVQRVVVWLVHRMACPCDRSPITWSFNGPRVGERRLLCHYELACKPQTAKQKNPQNPKRPKQRYRRR